MHSNVAWVRALPSEKGVFVWRVVGRVTRPHAWPPFSPPAPAPMDRKAPGRGREGRKEGPGSGSLFIMCRDYVQKGIPGPLSGGKGGFFIHEEGGFILDFGLFSGVTIPIDTMI